MSGKVYTDKKGSKSSSSRASRSRISNRKPSNRHSFEGDTEGVSRLVKKLKSSTSKDDIEVGAAFGYRIVNFCSVFITLSKIRKFKCRRLVDSAKSDIQRQKHG